MHSCPNVEEESLLIWSFFLTDISGHIWKRETMRYYSYYWTFIIRFYYWSKSKISLHVCVHALASNCDGFCPFPSPFGFHFRRFIDSGLSHFFLLLPKTSGMDFFFSICFTASRKLVIWVFAFRLSFSCGGTGQVQWVIEKIFSTVHWIPNRRCTVSDSGTGKTIIGSRKFEIWQIL